MNALSKEAIEIMDRMQKTINFEIATLIELGKKPELIFNPETLTHWQREGILNLKHKEDIYLISLDGGKWKVWKRIFN